MRKFNLIHKTIGLSYRHDTRSRSSGPSMGGLTIPEAAIHAGNLARKDEGRDELIRLCEGLLRSIRKQCSHVNATFDKPAG